METLKKELINAKESKISSYIDQTSRKLNKIEIKQELTQK